MRFGLRVVAGLRSYAHWNREEFGVLSVLFSVTNTANISNPAIMIEQPDIFKCSPGLGIHSTSGGAKYRCFKNRSAEAAVRPDCQTSRALIGGCD
jgi:hypothetical protein